MSFKIVKTNLYEQVLDAIIDNIKTGRFAKGEKLLSEIDLASSFNVSRNIIREALKILENFGVLESRNGVGTFISENAEEGLQNMRFFQLLKENTSIETTLETRLFLEPSAAYYAALRIDAEGIKNLKHCLKKQFDKKNNMARYEHDFDLHLLIAYYSGNSLCKEFLTTLMASLKGSLYRDFNRHVSVQLHIEDELEHCQIVDAIANHDARQAKTLMEKHLKKRILLFNPDFETNISS